MTQTVPNTPGTGQHQEYREEWQVMGNQLLATVERLIHEGNVRRIIIKQEGRTVMEIPLTIGVVGAVLAPMLAAVGALTVIEQLVIVVWGPEAIPLPKPASLRGSIFLGASSIETYRLFALFVGLAVAAAMHLVLTRTRIGLVVRAGVEDREMVQALGYRIRRVFVGVFIAGTALAGMGGMMWGQYQTVVTSQIGDGMIILVFIILIIGGLGSVGGCFIGAILVGLASNYVGFLAPKLALGSNILLMALILLWRPRGLFPIAGH